jgi:hypothetical protein
LKIGITFAILSCTGTTPVFKEREITCLRGVERVRACLDRRSVDSPLQSSVFFTLSSLMTSTISELVTGVDSKSKNGWLGGD